MVGRIEMDWGDRHHMLLQRFVVGILAAGSRIFACRQSSNTYVPCGSTFSTIGLSKRRRLRQVTLHSLNRIARVHSEYSRSRWSPAAIRAQHLGGHPSRISRPDIESKSIVALLEIPPSRECQNRTFQGGRHRAGIHHVISKIDPPIDTRHDQCRLRRQNFRQSQIDTINGSSIHHEHTKPHFGNAQRLMQRDRMPHCRPLSIGRYYPHLS